MLGLAVGTVLAPDQKKHSNDFGFFEEVGNCLARGLTMILGGAVGSGLGCEVGKLLSRDDRVFDPMVPGDMDSLKTLASCPGEEPDLQERAK